MLFGEPGTFAARVKRVRAEFAGDAVIGKILSFIDDSGSRPLMMPAVTDNAADAGAAP